MYKTFSMSIYDFTNVKTENWIPSMINELLGIDQTPIVRDSNLNIHFLFELRIFLN